MANERTISIKDILKGCEPGRIQSVGYMQVIPLVSEVHDDRFVSPNKARVGTAHYGTLVVKNPAEETLIVPPQTAYIVKMAAQDHALPHIGMIKGKGMRSFDTAMCVQQTQGGYIPEGEHRMLVLPLPLREAAHKARKEHNYGRLWPAIVEMNKSAGIADTFGSAGHLEYFLKAFQEELDSFVAQFEPVENQVGAIVFINGKVAGVERTPSPDYWLSIWPTLIRECYGSMAIIEAHKHGNKPPVPKTRVSLGKANSLHELKQKLVESIEEEYTRVKTIVTNLLNLELKAEVDETFDKQFDIEALSHKRFVGQVITEGGEVLYASLVATANSPTTEEWCMQEDFKM
jgi:hypothetical protein